MTSKKTYIGSTSYFYSVWIPYFALRFNRANAVLFLGAVLILAFVLANLITAVIVERAVDTGNHEREVRVAASPRRSCEG